MLTVLPWWWRISSLPKRQVPSAGTDLVFGLQLLHLIFRKICQSCRTINGRVGVCPGSSTSLMAVVTLDSISSSNLMFLPATKPPVFARLHSRTNKAACNCKTEGYAQGLQTKVFTFGVHLSMTTFGEYPTLLESIAMVILKVVQLLTQRISDEPRTALFCRRHEDQKIITLSKLPAATTHRAYYYFWKK